MSDTQPTPREISIAKSLGISIQPEPVRNDLPSAHDLVAEDILRKGYEVRLDPKNMRGFYNSLLAVFVALRGGTNPAIEEIGRRREFGLQKYDTLLQPFNGRDHIGDTTDEIADALAYLRAHIFEQENPDVGEATI